MSNSTRAWAFMIAAPAPGRLRWVFRQTRTEAPEPKSPKKSKRAPSSRNERSYNKICDRSDIARGFDPDGLLSRPRRESRQGRVADSRSGGERGADHLPAGTVSLAVLLPRGR